MKIGFGYDVIYNIHNYNIHEKQAWINNDTNNLYWCPVTGDVINTKPTQKQIDESILKQKEYLAKYHRKKIKPLNTIGIIYQKKEYNDILNPFLYKENKIFEEINGDDNYLFNTIIVTYNLENRLFESLEFKKHIMQVYNKLVLGGKIILIQMKQSDPKKYIKVY